MSDRELLELAAKAAGYKIIAYANERGLWLHGMDDEWNPIDDDADNRMLSNKLELSIVFAEESDICWVTVFGAPYAWYDQFDAVQEAYPVSRAGQDAAVRLAVVRAAAEIGRNMP